MNIAISLCLSARDAAPDVRARTYDNDGRSFTYAVVRWPDITIQSSDPAQLLLVAEVFTDAARQLSQLLDAADARTINAEPVAVPA